MMFMEAMHVTANVYTSSEELLDSTGCHTVWFTNCYIYDPQTLPEFSRVVVKVGQFIQFFFKHFPNGLRHYKVLDSLTELFRNGLLIIFLEERKNE